MQGLQKTLTALNGTVQGLKLDVIRQRKRAGGEAGSVAGEGDGQSAPAADRPTNEAPSAGRAFASSVRLHAEIAALPAGIRDELLGSLEAEEISVEQALERARWIKKGMGAGETLAPQRGAPRPTPPGVAGSAPHDPPAPTFAYREDWEKFRRENRGEAMRLLQGAFDPTTLPRRG